MLGETGADIGIRPGDFTHGRCKKGGEHADQGGLAAAIGAVQGKDLPLLQRKLDPRKNGAAAAHAGKIVSLEHEFAACPITLADAGRR